MERLSSGVRINAAKDDAAGLAISTRMTADIKGLAGDVTGVASERASLALGEAMTRVQEITNSVEEWSEDNLQNFRDQVRDQPLASVALSVGVGALIGAILFRR
jgi:flagellin